MQYTQYYCSPIGGILLAADAAGLTGLWFEGARHYAKNLADEHESGETAHLAEACRWLDIYFSGRAPEFLPALHIQGTAFQRAVWQELLRIPYGQTVTYGELARVVAKAMGRTAMSAQAVGNAVSRNNISIIIPCHRVIGRDGGMVGYAGGLDKKEYLLDLERGQAGRPVRAGQGSDRRGQIGEESAAWKRRGSIKGPGTGARVAFRVKKLTFRKKCAQTTCLVL